jgi:hypothetical protein
VINIPKTGLTLQLERQIWLITKKVGTFGCFEVTIGYGGKERVDYITVDTKGIWRCYEIKISKSDFHSKAKKTFLGHYNYFVMPKELYEDVKDEIHNNIGVYTYNEEYPWANLVKRPKKQKLGVDEQILKNSMIRSLYREFEKQYDSSIPATVENLKKRINKLEKDKEYNQDLYLKYQYALYDLCDKYKINHKEAREIVRKY